MAKKKTAVKKKSVKKSVKKSATKPAAKTLAIPKSKVAVGKEVPQFELASTGGKNVGSQSLSGKNVVLYFYPKDATPGCTLEGQDFSKLKSQFEAHKTEVYGISRDSIKSHESFKAKQNYSVDLLSDEGEKLCSIFGVIKLKNMYGKKVRGIERSTFVLNSQGVLVKEWRGVKVPGHAEEVLHFVKTI